MNLTEYTKKGKVKHNITTQQ